MKSLPLTLSFCLLAAFSAFGQNRIKVEAESQPAFEDLESPEFGNSEKSWDPKDWLEMEIEFEVTLVDPKEAEFVDNLTVVWYVAAKDPDSNSRKFILLQKDVEHINIPVGEKLFSSVYLSPSAIVRLSGGDRAAENVVDRVGGEIRFNGNVVATFSSKGDKDWWKSGELSRYDKIPLRSKNETPFHYFWWDRYAENKVERR